MGLVSPDVTSASAWVAAVTRLASITVQLHELHRFDWPFCSHAADISLGFASLVNLAHLQWGFQNPMNYDFFFFTPLSESIHVFRQSIYLLKGICAATILKDRVLFQSGSMTMLDLSSQNPKQLDYCRKKKESDSHIHKTIN